MTSGRLEGHRGFIHPEDDVLGSGDVVSMVIGHGHFEQDAICPICKVATPCPIIRLAWSNDALRERLQSALNRVGDIAAEMARFAALYDRR